MIHIITDTTSGLPAEISTRYHIPVIPQIISFGNQSFYEGINLDNPSFLTMLKNSEELPKTAAPPPELFVQEFKKIIPSGDPILCIHPSSEVSGTVRSATVAAQEFPVADIRIIDTRTIGSPVSSLVEYAAKLSEQGKDIDTIELIIRQMIPLNRVYFIVDTFEYLVKGGRIGGATALLGSILQIKPILSLKNGRVDQFEKERTKKHAINRLIELVKDQASSNENAFISVMHAAVPLQAAELAGRLCSEFGLGSIPILDVPPAIVVHGGPGILAVAFFTDGS